METPSVEATSCWFAAQRSPGQVVEKPFAQTWMETEGSQPFCDVELFSHVGLGWSRFHARLCIFEAPACQVMRNACQRACFNFEHVRRVKHCPGPAMGPPTRGQLGPTMRQSPKQGLARLTFDWRKRSRRFTSAGARACWACKCGPLGMMHLPRQIRGPTKAGATWSPCFKDNPSYAHTCRKVHAQTPASMFPKIGGTTQVSP